MDKRHEDLERDLDAGLEAAFGESGGTGASMLGRIERLTGIKSQLLLHDGPDDDSPLTHVHRLTRDDEGAEDDSRYQVAGEIAKGGVGVVYKCRDRDLGRDVAVKVLRKAHVGKPDVFHRFVEEAQIGGQLQHPGIVPVYSLGLQPDGRPSFAMKLVKGKTLSAALADRKSPADDRRTYLRNFERICQTMAYAHARGVIHRDLKPSNVMLGAFGEVLVVDWGFGKVLGREEPEPAPEKTVVTTVRTEADGSGSIAGSVMGTPAYMPPEQALGHVEDLDEQTDVFALGAILTEILTGKPPYVGKQKDLLVMAGQAKLDDALARLDACDADPEITALAKRCLEPLRGNRPRHAGEVADEMGRMLSKAEERAQAAELEAVKERSRERHARQHATAERRAKRLTIGLAAAVLVFVAGGGAFFLMQGAKQRTLVAEARSRVEQSLEEASRLRGRGEWSAALAEAREAEVAAAELDEGTRGKIGELIRGTEAEKAAADAEAEQIEKDRNLLAELERIRLERFDIYSRPLATDEELVMAFRAYGLDLEGKQPAALAKLIRERGAAFAVDVASALDYWARLRRTVRQLSHLPSARIEDLAAACDPDPVRDRIRELADRNDLRGLEQLAGSVETSSMRVRSLQHLGQWLILLGSPEASIEILEAATRRGPDDPVVRNTLGNSLSGQGRHEEALRHFTALVALRPNSGGCWSNLALALSGLERVDEALVAARRAIELAPLQNMAHNNLGVALAKLGRLEEALEAYREAVRLDPEAEVPLANLASAMCRTGDPKGALNVGQRAVQLHPESAPAHSSLGQVLTALGQKDAAIRASRRAVRIDPEEAGCRHNLGLALHSKARYREAQVELREALRLAPHSFGIHNALGMVLADSGDLEQAHEHFQVALRLNPNSVNACNNLGFLMRRQGKQVEELAFYRRAIAMDPEEPRPIGNLGSVLLDMGRFKEALDALEKYEELRDGRPDRMDRSGVIEPLRRLVRLEPRIPRLLAGDEQPKDSAECLDVGLFCWYRKNYAAVCRFYYQAFAESATSTQGNLPYPIRAAALCGTGQGEDADGLSEDERARWRKQALEWLREDIQWTRENGKPLYFARHRHSWLLAADLSGVRDPDALERLPVEEREAWTAFWDELRRTTAKWFLRMAGECRKKWMPDSAESACRRVLEIDPENLSAHFSLGMALPYINRHEEAIAAYGQVISRRPDYAEAHCNMGHCLTMLGRYREALESMRRGHEIGSARENWRYPSARWVEACEKNVERESRIASVLDGSMQPGDAKEMLAFASILSRSDYYAAALRLHESAFREDPELETTSYRYNAACCAACTAGGQSKDAGTLDGEEQKVLRTKALAWMRAVLRSYLEMPDALRRRYMLNHALREPELAPVRDYAEIEKLPRHERKEWHEFWCDLRAALDRTWEAK